MVHLSPESPDETVERGLLYLEREWWWIVRNRREATPRFKKLSTSLGTARGWHILAVGMSEFACLFG